MTLFIDLRAQSVGGGCSDQPSLWDDGTTPVTLDDFIVRVRGLDIVLATHGFNVNRHHGVDSLSHWAQLCQLPSNVLLIAVLWPGDSKYIPVLDYPFEGDEAIASGCLLAEFLNVNAESAASISLVSHSLGARTALETLTHLELPVRNLILMAGAIEDDCLINEYASAAGKAQRILTLASKEDRVLEFAFPLGNPASELVMRGHPYFKGALGRGGPATPLSLEQRGGSWQIPDGWKYGHGDYLPGSVVDQSMPPPITSPAADAVVPANPKYDGWESAWSACAVSSAFR